MSTAQATARQLAGCMLGGTWDVEDLVRRGDNALGKRPRWLRPLARNIAAAYAHRPRPRASILAEFICRDPGFQRSWQRHQATYEESIIVWRRAVMSPCSGRPAMWNVPELPTADALAKWLDLTLGELGWFADCQARERRLPRGPLAHYRYRWSPKRAGGFRLIETPKPRLMAIQRKLLHGILDRIPPHEAAHGFRRGRSIRTFAAPHVGQRVVIRLDLGDFFTSIASPRVVAVFLTAGYPEPVAMLLAGLCTNSASCDAWMDEACAATAADSRRHDALRWPHLPQGAPTSPALANLCAYRLDCRLQGLARSVQAEYTRYADDLVFSGGDELARAARRFHVHVAAIAIEEGFRVHPRKTRVMRQSVRQHVAGVVVNEHLNVRRSDFDRLKATLHNCVRHGPISQNRSGLDDFRAHLAGRIAHVRMLHPERGARLRAVFDRIAW